MRVRDLETCDDQAGARDSKCFFLGDSDDARDFHEVRGDVTGRIRPFLIRGTWYDQNMAGRGGLDGRECNAFVVGPHEATCPDAGNDVFKDCSHEAILTPEGASWLADEEASFRANGLPLIRRRMSKYQGEGPDEPGFQHGTRTALYR